MGSNLIRLGRTAYLARPIAKWNLTLARVINASSDADRCGRRNARSTAFYGDNFSTDATVKPDRRVDIISDVGTDQKTDLSKATLLVISGADQGDSL